MKTVFSQPIAVQTFLAQILVFVFMAANFSKISATIILNACQGAVSIINALTSWSVTKSVKGIQIVLIQ